MGKYKWQGAAFFLLIFILSLGLSYLAFNENSVERVETNEQVMSIALVNEDEGAVFNEEKIVFGDEFANSVNRDSNHEWYIVSRGVAENGYNRGSYDMVIIIPNDFSEKSLSIHLENPEPVSLQYKINATGHENVRAEAEKTAGNILNEFNKRLIDVYFASIIGNLQEAQDNIGDIIAKEKEYTGLYRQQIYEPLADYTNQFQTVQDYTEISKDSYQGLEDVLEGFQSNLSEEVDNKSAFSSEIDSVIQLKEDESVIKKTFSDFLDQFTNRMSDGEVLTRLALLEQQNELVQQQFLQPEDRDRTIAKKANLIEKEFEKLVLDINQFETALNEKLHTELETVVRDNLELDFGETIEPKVELLFHTLDKSILTDITAQIDELPSLSYRQIVNSGLEGDTLQDILNVVKVTRKFNNEFKYDPNINSDGRLLTEKIQEIKNDLALKGITVTDDMELPTYDGEEQFLNVSIPEQFELRELRLMFAGDKEPRSYWNKNSIKLESPPAGPLTIELDLRLKNAEMEIDVFSPIEWTWEISQEGMEEKEEEEEPGSSNGSDDPGDNSGKDVDGKKDKDGRGDEKDKGDNHDDKISGDQNGQEENNDNGENNNNYEDKPSEEGNLETINALSHLDNESEETKQEEENEVEENGDGGNGEEGDEGENEAPPEIPEEPEEPEPAPPIKSETIIKTNNYLVQKVLSTLIPNPKDELVEAATVMVNDYYKLFSLYELYFGLNLSDEELFDAIDEQSLRDLASEDSLYTFIAEMKIKDFLEKHIVDSVTKSVTSDIQNSMRILEQNIADYVKLVENTSNESKTLVEIIADTKENANVLNEELTGLLEELAAWRDTSHQLIEEKSVVLERDQEVNNAVLNLDTGYQPLLLASESLAEQARSNFDVANNVYDTFDAIDQQAANIQESGTNIVTNATDLANKWTEKALEDENFAQNFNEVLSNSRVGDRPNENLYRFLANPVQTKNTGIITEGESFTAYFITIILSIVTLFTAYVISTLNLRKKNTDVFEGEQSIVASNKSMTIVTALVGVIEGIAIGLLSFYLLELPFEKMYPWLAIILLFTVVMLFFATYLLRQLKMIGMFILLALLSLYLLLTRTLGFRFENSALAESLREISPLQHMEAVISNMIESDVTPALFTFIILVVLAAVGFVLNLFVFVKNKQDEEMDDESQAEAN